MGGSDLADKISQFGDGVVEELTPNEQIVIVDHISWLIRDTWKKYEQSQTLNTRSNNQSKPLNDNSSLNIR